MGSAVSDRKMQSQQEYPDMWVLIPKWVFIIFFIGLIGLTAWFVPFVNELLISFGINPLPLRILFSIPGGVALLLYFSWRFFWRIPWLGERLSRSVFPDLNGEYDVEILSNWSIQKKILDAAKTPKTSFDPSELSGKDSELEKYEFRAAIKQSWFRFHIELQPKQGASRALKTSKTLVSRPIKASEFDRPKLVYLYEQENDQYPSTDEKRFLGAALLDIDLANVHSFGGEFWTQRSWRQGVNTAGKITFHLTKSKPILF